MSRIIINYLENGLSRLRFSAQFVDGKTLSQNLNCVQCVRQYHRPRKPFWLPMAKTKLFRIPQKPVIPEEEMAELFRLIRIYRTEMKSLRQYFKEQLMSQTTAPEVIEERKEREAEQHANCVKENELWNAEVAKIREARLAKEAKQREEKIFKEIIDYEKEQKELLEKIEADVRKEKEKSFITPENFDEALELALSKVEDYNFAIDTKGNIYQGRYGKPPRLETKPAAPLALAEPGSSEVSEARS